MKKTKQQPPSTLLKIPKVDQDAFLLLQLPDSLSIQAFHENGDLSFVSHKANAQACLVTSDKSFALCRVETSNAYILRPPPTNKNDDDDEDDDEHNSQQRPHKKAKRDDSTTTSTASTTTAATPDIETHSSSAAAASSCCRLLGGGSGAFFLELKERHLDLKALEGLLTTFDPYNNNSDDGDPSFFPGTSLPELALELQVSERQVLDGLKVLQNALLYQSKYCLLSEEAVRDVRRAILGALTECKDFGDYAAVEGGSRGILKEQLVKESMKRVAAEEHYPQLERAIHLVLKNMTQKEDSEGFFQINFKQVAVFVAHELFVRPIWSHEELVKEWQARVPGVGDGYHICVDEFLQGVAIRRKSGSHDDDDAWEYLPAEKMAKDPGERLAELFAAQEAWTKEELMPYLSPLTTKVDEVLVTYARAVLASEDGSSKMITKYAKARS